MQLDLFFSDSGEVAMSGNSDSCSDDDDYSDDSDVKSIDLEIAAFMRGEWHPEWQPECIERLHDPSRR